MFWQSHEILLRIFLLIFFLVVFAGCERSKKKIYVQLESKSACFRNLNATHQVGCSSQKGGNVGILHYMEGPDDWNWVLRDGPTLPFAVLIDDVDFNLTIVRKLASSKRVNGIMVISLHNDSALFSEPKKFSADKSCPNDAYGLYHKDSDYGNCKKFTWNLAGDGMFFEDIQLPIFVITNDTDVYKLKSQCYERFNKPNNGTARSYPLCAVQLKDRMEAAKDSVTCIRRTNHVSNLNSQPKYCDPLADKNIIATIKTEISNNTNDVAREPNSVIVVGTQMDSFSMFLNEYVSSDKTVASLVCLLAVAEALGTVREEISKVNKSKDIMFAFFQGESWDYIGSSRMVYEMEKQRFPSEIKNGSWDLRPINLTHVSHFIELSQLGLRDDGKLWIHKDPISTKTVNVSTEVDKMIDLLKYIGINWNVDIDNVTEPQPLPPASVQRFLMKQPLLPTVVISDHKKAFTNKYYNSRLDLPQFINASSDVYDNITDQAEKLTKLSTVIARMLYELSTGNALSSLNASTSTVTHLLYCFLKSPKCELFYQSVDEIDKNVLQKTNKPFPFYVSVETITNHVTILTQSLLAQYIGERITTRVKSNCTNNDTTPYYQYLWMQGNMKENSTERVGWCIRSTVRFSEAKSPAFLDEMSGYDWKSGVYSTWTESVWATQDLRMFLVPSEQFEIILLCVGLLFLLVPMVIMYFVNNNADVIFAMDVSNPTVRS